MLALQLPRTVTPLRQELLLQLPSVVKLQTSGLLVLAKYEKKGKSPTFGGLVRLAF